MYYGDDDVIFDVKVSDINKNPFKVVFDYINHCNNKISYIDEFKMNGEDPEDYEDAVHKLLGVPAKNVYFISSMDAEDESSWNIEEDKELDPKIISGSDPDDFNDIVTFLLFIDESNYGGIINKMINSLTVVDKNNCIFKWGKYKYFLEPHMTARFYAESRKAFVDLFNFTVKNMGCKTVFK